MPIYVLSLQTFLGPILCTLFLGYYFLGATSGSLVNSDKLSSNCMSK